LILGDRVCNPFPPGTPSYLELGLRDCTIFTIWKGETGLFAQTGEEFGDNSFAPRKYYEAKLTFSCLEDSSPAVAVAAIAAMLAD
jgi:hypothetical protein